MKQFMIEASANGMNSMAIPQSDTIGAKVLAANVAEAITVPTGANKVLFSSTADFYCLIGGTAAVPTDGDTGKSELNPTLRSVKPGDSISIISEEACKVTLAFYS